MKPLFIGLVIVTTTLATLIVLNNFLITPETTYLFETIKPEVISFYGT